MTVQNESSNLAAYEQRIRERLMIDETSPTGLRWNQSAHGKVKGQHAGVAHSNGYLQISIRANINRKFFFAHRVVWFLAHGRWPDGDIDHINGDRMDNRLVNLREASRSENLRNSAMLSSNTSGIKGVSFHKRAGKWQAQIRMDGKINHIGLFANIADAERAIRSAREKLHGEFANHGGK